VAVGKEDPVTIANAIIDHLVCYWCLALHDSCNDSAAWFTFLPTTIKASLRARCRYNKHMNG
jgi:hypothetical protein